VLGNPNWSPDGHSIVVDATTSDSGYSTFYVIGHDGSVVRSIPSGSLRSGSFASIGSPSWLPDGRILFTAETGGTVEIWTMAADGTDVQTVLPVEGTQAAASPDGKSIAYLSGETDWSFSLGIVERLWIFDDWGPGAQPVPRLLWQQPNCCIRLGYAGPEWSPDGTHIAFTGVASSPNQPATADGLALVTVDVVTGKANVLMPTDGTRPPWRPIP
jgi:Tol biopolymer transport system component